MSAWFLGKKALRAHPAHLVSMRTAFRRGRLRPRREWVWILAVLAGCAKTERLPPSPVITIPQGRLQGYTDTQGVWVYKGIPFAKPPVGPLRWAPPQPPESWGP